MLWHFNNIHSHSPRRATCTSKRKRSESFETCRPAPSPSPTKPGATLSWPNHTMVWSNRPGVCPHRARVLPRRSAQARPALREPPGPSPEERAEPALWDIFPPRAFSARPGTPRLGSIPTSRRAGSGRAPYHFISWIQARFHSTNAKHRDVGAGAGASGCSPLPERPSPGPPPRLLFKTLNRWSVGADRRGAGASGASGSPVVAG